MMDQFGDMWRDEPEILNDFDDGPPLNHRNNRYSNAYGDYRGGYGPGGGFGPPRFMRPGPFGPRPPPYFIPGRGYGQFGPPNKRRYMDDKAIRYLLRCGVTKDNLKNLPRELLNLIEPEYCGLCAHTFESFAISRMHYISKNHLKNQKKFLAKYSEGFTGLNPREIPMKSRDLYCELCDVHITSKTHAESHYSGKIHRAIADGRKNPKNPMLLQPGMEQRINQLMRREKKHLKAIEEVLPEFDDIKEPKCSPAELYCDICKTSVTCTEQMTMHLNGKKHLTKEKQHILRMMRGDETGKEEDVDNSTNVADDAKVKEEAPLDSQIEDWSKGAGETWDETEVAQE